MTSRERRAWWGLGALALTAWIAGCGSDGTSCSTSADCPNHQSCVRGVCAPGDGGAGDARGDGGGMDATVDAGPPCNAGATCPGGVCVAGACCASEHVCGEQCCGDGQQCFANVCVTPGAPCRTTTDCPSGSYCEPSLGDAPDGGVADGGADGSAGDGGRVCSAPSPVQGRCLAQPPRCPTDGDGGAEAGAPDAGGGTCIAQCEYRPPVDRLNTTLAWSWGQPTAPRQYPNFTDVWSTPAVGRIYDANCDGQVDTLDPPDIVFVAGHSVDATTGLGTCCQCNGGTPTACHTGVLRVLDGRTGADLLAVRSASASSAGFAGISVAIGDLDNDHFTDIAAVTGEGYVVVIDRDGHVTRTSDHPLPGNADASFGWGGGLAIADMNNDGFPEIAYGATVFTTQGGGLTLVFTGAGGTGGGAVSQQLSTFADLDGAADHHLELLAGNTAYRADGTMLWHRTDLPDGFPAVADFDGDGNPEAVLVSGGRVWVLNGATGATLVGPTTLPGTGSGGAPTIADFDGHPGAEIGVAMATYYSVLKVNLAMHTATVLWQSPNHDLSSSVTGSTVFDFEGDGVAEVLYADECFVWVFDGPTGHVRWAGLTSSFTGTEASVVADVDGDGHAEIVSIANGVDPSSAGWKCAMAPWNAADTATGRPAWTPPAGAMAYRGLRVYRDVARSWVGTRPLWNQHTYHVSNVCVAGDTACDGASYDGQIPRVEHANWTLPWLNNFRQNVQQQGLFGAPDATVTLAVRCAAPPVLTASVRNLGEALLPAGVTVGFYVRNGTTDTMLGMGTTTTALFPGAAQNVTLATPASTDPNSTFVAKILVDPAMPTFRECRTDNNESAPEHAPCPG